MRIEIQGENGIVFKGIISEVLQSIKRASDISPFPLVPRGPLGRLWAHLASRSPFPLGLCEDERAFTVFDPAFFLRRYFCSI